MGCGIEIDLKDGVRNRFSGNMLYKCHAVCPHCRLDYETGGRITMSRIILAIRFNATKDGCNSTDELQNQLDALSKNIKP